MPPRIPSSASLFRSIVESARRPSRLTLGVAAATAVAATGVVVGLSTDPAPAAGTFSNLGAVNHASTVHAAGHVGARSSHAASGSVRSTQAAHAAPEHRAAPARHRAAPARHHAAPARHHAAPARHHAAPARQVRPYLIYDSVTPSAIPGHHVVATYATGNYAVSPSQVAGRKVLWIDTNGTDHAASVLDVEPGDATPSLAASWARARLTANPKALARIYTMRSEWPATQAAIATLPARMRSHIRWWIADPTGYPHIVPGADATQWYWGSSYDITTAAPRF